MLFFPFLSFFFYLSSCWGKKTLHRFTFSPHPWGRSKIGKIMIILLDSKIGTLEPNSPFSHYGSAVQTLNIWSDVHSAMQPKIRLASACGTKEANRQSTNRPKRRPGLAMTFTAKSLHIGICLHIGIPWRSELEL